MTKAKLFLVAGTIVLASACQLGTNPGEVCFGSDEATGAVVCDQNLPLTPAESPNPIVIPVDSVDSQ